MTEEPIMPKRRTILVLAYSISPVRGSEYAVGWNYVTHMSHDNDLIVLYGLAGDHMGDIDEMADAAEKFGGRVVFIPVMPDRRARIANYLNRSGRLPYSFYIAYRYWHLSALGVARRILTERTVDIVHYLCPIGYREPGYLWKLQKPYIWGPIGGIAPRPVRTYFDLGTATGIKTLVRNWTNAFQFRWGRRVRRAIRETDLLLAATTENSLEVARVHGRTPVFVPENAIVAHETNARTVSAPDKPLELIWVGTVEARKALTILLGALATIDPARWHLRVLGSGPLLDASKTEAKMLGIASSIEWLGNVPRSQALECFRSSDLHILTSLAEAHSTVLWEAMSAGVPTIAIDHCGMHDSIDDAGGIRIPLGSISQLRRGFAEAIARLVDDRVELQKFSAGAIACAERNSWSCRRVFWNDAYDQAENLHTRKGNRR